MAEVTKTECSYCGNELTDEEVDAPFQDEDGDMLCLDCELEHFHFTCDLCGNYAPNEQHGETLVVWESVPQRFSSRGVSPGIYRITKWPYYTSDHFSMWLHGDCLELISDVPSVRSAEDLYPCGHLCDECREKAEEQSRNNFEFGDGI